MKSRRMKVAGSSTADLRRLEAAEKRAIAAVEADNRAKAEAKAKQTAIAADDQQKREMLEESKTYTRTIDLSSRGWGDYSAVEWTGDLRRTDADIIGECQRLLSRAHDVDHPQTAKQIAEKLAEARVKMAAEKRAKQSEMDRVIRLQALARETGKPQVIRSWTTGRCMNGEEQCSFDSAVETIDGDGNRKKRYSCCY